MTSKAVLLVKMKEILDSLDDSFERDLLNKVMDNLSEKFRDDFRKLVNHMEVDDMEFLAYWETNKECQEAFRGLINRRIGVLEQMVKTMKELVS